MLFFKHGYFRFENIKSYKDNYLFLKHLFKGEREETLDIGFLFRKEN